MTSNCAQCGAILPEESFRIGDIFVDQSARLIKCNGSGVVRLTRKDYELAVVMLKNVGRLMSRAELYEKVWGIDTRLLHTRTLDAHVARVRKALHLQPAHGWRLQAVYREGYRLEKTKCTDACVESRDPKCR